jgi:hypothetical protein
MVRVQLEAQVAQVAADTGEQQRQMEGRSELRYHHGLEYRAVHSDHIHR